MAFRMFGVARRNEPWTLIDPRPIANYGTRDLCCGDAGLDGYTVLAKARPGSGERPAVDERGHFAIWGPDPSWEA